MAHEALCTANSRHSTMTMRTSFIACCALALSLSLAHAQTDPKAAAKAAGRDFASVIKPSSSGQVINPGALPDSLKSQATTPSATPQGLGGFNKAKSGSLESSGRDAQEACKNHVPGSDPKKDQECAAVNFMNNACITPSPGQNSVIRQVGGSVAPGSNCTGTFGEGAQRNQFPITNNDSIFTGINLTGSKAKDVSDSCVEKEVVVTPAVTQKYTCVKSGTSTLASCSQTLQIKIDEVITTKQATPKYLECPIFYTDGSAYPMALRTFNADLVNVCHAATWLNRGDTYVAHRGRRYNNFAYFGFTPDSFRFSWGWAESGDGYSFEVIAAPVRTCPLNAIPQGEFCIGTEASVQKLVHYINPMLCETDSCRTQGAGEFYPSGLCRIEANSQICSERTASYSWKNLCVPYETSAGQQLPSPQ
jgi:hypothetical protein